MPKRLEFRQLGCRLVGKGNGHVEGFIPMSKLSKWTIAFGVDILQSQEKTVEG